MMWKIAFKVGYSKILKNFKVGYGVTEILSLVAVETGFKDL